jgi:hypothetical protein
LGRCPCRFVLAAAYWLNPLAIIFSSYHGNTDSAVAFFLLLCCWFLNKGRAIGAGIAIAASFWIKLPGLLAIPALVLWVQGWRQRLIFLCVAAIVALAGYLPPLIQDPQIVGENVIGYRGQTVHTTAGIPVWGPRVLLFSVILEPQKWPQEFHEPILFFLRHGWRIGIGLSLVLAWLRRSRRSVTEVCATIASVYLIVCAFTDSWTFQYFAWSLPFWFFLPSWFYIPAVLLAGAYIYSLYWFLCGNPWLLGQWNFIGHAYWPALVIWLRNAAVVFFFISACLFLALAFRQELSLWLKRLPPEESVHSL